MLELVSRVSNVHSILSASGFHLAFICISYMEKQVWWRICEFVNWRLRWAGCGQPTTNCTSWDYCKCLEGWWQVNELPSLQRRCLHLIVRQALFCKLTVKISRCWSWWELKLIFLLKVAIVIDSWFTFPGVCLLIHWLSKMLTTPRYGVYLSYGNIVMHILVLHHYIRSLLKFLTRKYSSLGSPKTELKTSIINAE